MRIVAIEAAYLQRVLDVLECLSPLACSEEIAAIKESLKARPVAQVKVVDCHEAGVCVQSGLRAERQGSPIKPVVDPALDVNQRLAFKLGWKSAEEAHGVFAITPENTSAGAQLSPAQSLPISEAQIDSALAAACLRNTPESRKDMRRALEAALSITSGGFR